MLNLAALSCKAIIAHYDIRLVGAMYFVFCFGITYDCVKRVQASNTLLDKPFNGVARPSNVESEP